MTPPPSEALAGHSDAGTPDHGYAREGLRIPFISPGKPGVGPVTRGRLRRTRQIWAAGLVAALAASWLGGPALQAFALGMMLPGGGFLLHAAGPLSDILAHVALFAGSLLAVLLAAFIWVATGNLIAPVAVWLGSALWAAGMHHHQTWDEARVVVPLLVAGLILVMARRGRRALREAGERRDRINGYLGQARTTVTALDTVSGLPTVTEMKPEAMPLMRFLLDRALQPVDEFNGFDRIDEFREAARRYQICINAYSLSGQCYAHMPAFRGYLADAQQRMSLKMQQHKVWSYWALENFWGNLRLDADPVPRDNIMYTGWYGALLAMNMSNFGDLRFSQPGAIRLEHPDGRVFSYSFTEMCEHMHRNFRESDFCLFPCEPRWIYPMCNNFGAIALKVHDRMHGSSFWSDIEGRYREQLENEFITIDGRITAIRDYRTGVTIPGLTSAMADAAAAIFMNPLFPDLARRSWEIIRHELMHVDGGVLTLRTNGWDHIDFGNYRPSRFSTYAMLAWAAREMGDDEVCELLLARLENEYPGVMRDGVQHFPGASTGAHFALHTARNMRANAVHDMINVGMPAPWRDGPLLDRVSYPDVLVAKAVSDGRALDLVLHPGTPAGSRQDIGLAQLLPGRQYRVTGATESVLVADSRGQATLSLDIRGRTPVLILPEG